MRVTRAAVILAATAMAAAGCSSSPADTTPAAGATTPEPAATQAAAPPANGGTYTDTSALLTALTHAGIPCAAPSDVAAPTVKGATSMTGCDSPSDTGADSDSVAVVFDSGTDAQAYASSMLSSGLVDASAQIVVGANWVVNTESPYGDAVTAKLGGNLSAPSATAAAPATTAAPTKTVVLRKSGNGIESTKSFTVGPDWSLSYTFDCSSFGSQGNFQVYEDYPNGQALANALSSKGSDTTYQHDDAGMHSLEVNSECSWTITVTDGDTGQ